MEYEKGYVYKLMDQGGPTDNREPYFREAVEEMMRARTLCAKAIDMNCLPIRIRSMPTLELSLLACRS